MIRLRSKTGSQIFVLVMAGIISAMLFVPFGCEKDEPTAPVSFKTPGVYSGTYYVLRDWQDPDYEDTSLAYVTIDFKADLTFSMSVADTLGPGSEFRPCSVNGTYVFRRDTLSFEYSNPHPYPSEICDESVGPFGAFEYYVVQDYLVFISRGTDYRKLQFSGK